MHKKVREVFNSHVVSPDSIPVLVPRVYRYISKADEWWESNDHLFPSEDRTPEKLFITEHIPPLHKGTRNTLIDYFCPEGPRSGARSQDINNDFLVRLYLGKRRDDLARVRLGAKTYFGVRNFPLCLDQKEDIGLDAKAFTFSIADALSTLHWAARIDAADVEFVLGGAPCLTHRPLPPFASTHLTGSTSRKGTSVTHLWLLDFNLCQPIKLDEAGVDQAVKRLLDNDAYYPRPATDESLWLCFQDRYMLTSNHILEGSEHSRLQLLFLERLKEVMSARSRRKLKQQKGLICGQSVRGRRMP